MFPRSSFLFRLLATGGFVLLLAAGIYGFLPSLRLSEPQESADAAGQPLDLTRPVPRAQVLHLFRQLFALPAEDYLNWDEAAAAGKIPSDVQLFHEHILAFNQDATLDAADVSTEGFPFIELSEGVKVYPVLKASLGPQIGANVSQEDLNSLLPDLADAQRRVLEYTAVKEAEAEKLFTHVRLQPEEFTIVRLHAAEAPGTVAINSPEGLLSPLFIDRVPAINGRHIRGARVSTEPFVGLRLLLSEEGSEALATFTAENIGQSVAILIDGEIHATTAIVETIRTRDLQLPGPLDEEEAHALINSWAATGILEAAR